MIKQYQDVLNIIYEWLCMENFNKSRIETYLPVLSPFINTYKGQRYWSVSDDSLDDLTDCGVLKVDNFSFYSYYLNPTLKERDLIYSRFAGEVTHNLFAIEQREATFLAINPFLEFLYNFFDDIQHEISIAGIPFDKVGYTSAGESIKKIEYLKSFYSKENEGFLLESIEQVSPRYIIRYNDYYLIDDLETFY